MVKVRPFHAIRPSSSNVDHVATHSLEKPTFEDIENEIAENPRSFLHVEFAEATLPTELQHDWEKIAERKKENLANFLQEGWLITEKKPAYYIYRFIREEEMQYGLVLTISLEDYRNENITKAELGEEDPFYTAEIMDGIQAQTKPIFLSAAVNDKLEQMCLEIRRNKFPVYSFDDEEDVNHCVWVVDQEEYVREITTLFEEEVTELVIMQNAHLIEAAAKVTEARNGGDEKEVNSDYLLAIVFFGEEELIAQPLSGLFIHQLEAKQVGEPNKN